jgi:hypothetical protein
MKTTKKKLQLLLKGQNKRVFIYSASQLDALSGWNFEVEEFDENIQIEINSQGEAFWCYEDHEDQLETCDDPEKVIEQVFALEN